jgi:hypothetical protein
MPARYAIFASRGSVPPAPAVPRASTPRFGAPADVVPLLAFLQHHPPYVHVLADRTGAELTVVPRAVTGPPPRSSARRRDRTQRPGWARHAISVGRKIPAAQRRGGGER